MAASTNPLVWDFYRKVVGASGLGAPIEYYDTSSQSLYLDSGIQTRTAMIPDGHWSEAIPGAEIEVSDVAYQATEWEHPFTGLLVGCGDYGDELWYFRYNYAMELSQILKSGSWKARNDSKVKQLSLTLKNAGEGVFTGESTLFEPGARLTLAFALGAMTPLQIGQANLDDVDFDAYSDTVPLSGRNAIARLTDQTFDENTSFNGTGKEVVEWIFGLAGITRHVVGPSETPVDWAFKPAQKLMDGLKQIFEFYPGWDVDELPDGRLIVGYGWWRAEYIRNSVYQFNGNTEVVKRRTVKRGDGAFARLRVYGKDAEGEALTDEYRDILCWSHWDFGAHKTKHVAAADGMTQQELSDYADQIAAEMQYVGVGESFTGPLRPQLLVGDVASVTYDDSESTDLGLVTSVTHRFGDDGFWTDFSVDSGGVSTDGSSYVVTRTASVAGWNRAQTLADLIGIVAGKGGA